METLEDKINKFLNLGDGCGCGSGFGDGHCDGSCDGFGDGFGDGCGSGEGCGEGIKAINGVTVYIIDRMETVITSIRGDIAKGFVLNKDLTQTPCYVCKGENHFAHGSTLREAIQALQTKIFNDKPIDERIKMFKERFPDFNKSYANIELYNWHHILTGSCKMGRDSFAKAHGIDVKHGSMTIHEFIELTKDSYHGYIIRQL